MSNISEAERLLPLNVGDVVMAGAGMLAELRSTYFPGQTHALVRWMNVETDGTDWGAHHSLVSWSTVRSVS
jgi:hypothetical protein